MAQSGPSSWGEPVDAEAFASVTRRVDRLCAKGALDEALDLLKSTWPGRPEAELHTSRVDSLVVRAVIEAWLGRTQEAFDTLEATVRCGASAPLDAQTFDSLRTLSGWMDLERRNDERLGRERAASRVELIVRLPIGLRTDETAPAMLILHGDPGNLERIQGMWPSDAIVGRGLIVAYVQSSQLRSTGRYVWSSDPGVARSDVRKAFRDLCQRCSVDKEHVILAGFSAGATVALDLVFGHALPAAGFICLSPGRRPGSLTREAVAAEAVRGVRGAFLEGLDDWPDEEEREMVEMMEQEGFPFELMLHEGAGHVVPPDFADRLDRALRFILEPSRS